MFDDLKQRWRALRKDRPGQRFREYYRRRKEDRSSSLLKVLIMGGGLVLTAVGLFMLPAPGPGLPILLVGATMVAGESYAVAAALDWMELWLRKLITRARTRWKRAGFAARTLLVAAALLLTASMGFALYWVIFASCMQPASCAAAH